MLFCVNKMLEASDYDYFILNSLELQDKLMGLVKQLPKVKQEELTAKLKDTEKKAEVGSEELSQPSVSEQDEVSEASLKEAPLKKSLSSTKKLRRRKRRTLK